MYRTSIKGKLIGLTMIAAVGIGGMYAVKIHMKRFHIMFLHILKIQIK